MSYKRNKETQKRLKKIGIGPGKNYFIGVYYDEKQKRWKKCYLGNKRIRRQCSRKMRRYYKKALKFNDDYQIYNNCLHKKYSEYWWEVS